MFEESFKRFLQEQIRGAKGHRKERLQNERTLAGTKILLEKVVYPVFGSFDGFVLEYEMRGLSKVNLYYDACYVPLRILFEEDHYLTHAEQVSRNRFSMERMRIRTAAVHQYVYFPYSRDELLENPDFCANNLYELVGMLGAKEDGRLFDLPVYEREAVRCAVACAEPFALDEAAGWLQLKKEATRRVLRELEKKGLVIPVGGGASRCFKFVHTEKAVELLQKKRFRFR